MVVLTGIPRQIHVLCVTLRLALHVNTLHLNQILHVLSLAAKTTPATRRRRTHLSLVHLLGGLLLLLEAHIVKDTVKIDWVQLHRHLNGGVLLKVNQRRHLLVFEQPSGPFNSFALLK